MSTKAILILCAQALLVQSAFSYCISGNNYGAGLSGLSGYGLRSPALAAGGSGLACGAGLGSGAGLGYNSGAGYGGLAVEVIPTSGGALPVSSVSSIAPSGLSINSENVFDGALSVAGELPFVSAVALEGVLASGGAGAVSYSCGNGVTAIESIAPAGAYGGAGANGAASASGLAAGYGLGVNQGLGYGAGAIAPGFAYSGNGGCGCGCGQ
ncbi:hypothetical protein B5X24_HaOG208216 [Helicoverpa armigera]|uniref:Uncharacterized protein n=1 Tax=Helicoverpa armigera TaxID=29058 RepID=A0A2W1BKG6_HELAM|nr:hypothetical protein B5X24_HaOG208216 [Helicoverpa armigera]